MISRGASDPPPDPIGWDHQLGATADIVGVLVTLGGEHPAFDLGNALGELPSTGFGPALRAAFVWDLNVGNVFRTVAVGLLVRAGFTHTELAYSSSAQFKMTNLNSSDEPDPAVVEEESWWDANLAWRGQARIVQHNLFLAGGGGSPGVEASPFVVNNEVALHVRLGPFVLRLARVFRSLEAAETSPLVPPPDSYFGAHQFTRRTLARSVLTAAASRQARQLVDAAAAGEPPFTRVLAPRHADEDASHQPDPRPAATTPAAARRPSRR